MPTVRKDFVNRTDEITQLDLVLTMQGLEKDSLVLLHGMSGIGKTQLLARYLRLCNYNNIRIAYVDLSERGYLGLIDEVIEGLGGEGFEDLDKVYDEVLSRFQIKQAEMAATATSVPLVHPGAGMVFNQPVSGEQQIFVNGNANFNNPKITQIFNFQLAEPLKVQDQNQKKITQTFCDCLRTIARTQSIVLLLDHWDEASDPLKFWLEDHLIEWTTHFTLKKALVVVARENMPADMQNQMGILSLALLPFKREIALELWMKNGLAEETFDTLGPEIYGVPNLLALKIACERRKQGIG